MNKTKLEDSKKQEKVDFVIAWVDGSDEEWIKKKNKIKILIEGISQNIGGIETFVYNLYKNMDKSKYEICFLVDGQTKIAYYDEYQKDGCRFFYTENRKKNYFKYLKDLKNIYTNNEFDIIHINVMSYSLFERIVYACKYSNAKIIVHTHSTGYAKGYYKTKILHALGKLFVKNKKFYKIACGENAGKFMFGKEKFKIVNNGIDIERFVFSDINRDEIRKEFNIPNDTTVIAHVGAFYPVKNHKFLVEIFNEYLKINPNSKLVLVGEGYLQEQIKEQIKVLGLQEKVIFTGKRNDVDKIYSASDVYVMPSISEGLSVSLCEAQINGLKCYTSNDVDKGSDISGNVVFLSLNESAKYWAEKIHKDSDRDYNVLHKIPDKYKLNKSCKIMYKYYDDILQNNMER